MKIIVCGPPHSGKSVLISNLHRLMPLDSFQKIAANGDGEGLWSNNPNQKQVQDARVKSTNDAADFSRWKEQINNASEDIVLIDIGGRLQDDKNCLFEAADAFIIISNQADISNVEGWMGKGLSFNCKCLAVLESVLDGTDEVIETAPYLKARISNLERGCNVTDSIVVRKLAEIIVQQSGYRERVPIDFYKMSETIFECAFIWQTEDGIKVNNCMYPKDKALEIVTYVRTHYEDSRVYEIKGANANWMASIVGLTLMQKEGKGNRVQYFDPWKNFYVESFPLQKTKKADCQYLSWDIEEDSSSVYLKFKLEPKPFIQLEHIREYFLPEIDEEKDLYVSGRFPNWFTVSVLSSYKSKKKFIFEPGNDFICVQSPDDQDLGKSFSRCC